MSNALSSSLILIIQTVGGLYIIAVLLRFLLQLVQADFYNPISQLIVKATSWPLKPIRMIIPAIGRFDVSSIFLALIIQIFLYYINAMIKGYNLLSESFVFILYYAVKEISIQVLNIYMFSFIIIAIYSWVTPHNHNPTVGLLTQITEPLANKIRKILPPLGGVDFSFMILMLCIMVLKNFINNI